MKKIRILAVLVIIVFIGDMVSDGTSAFMDGWNEARDSTEYRFSDVDISVKPDKTLVVDSLFNTTIDLSFCSFRPLWILLHDAGSDICESW